MYLALKSKLCENFSVDSQYMHNKNNVMMLQTENWVISDHTWMISYLLKTFLVKIAETDTLENKNILNSFISFTKT